MLMTHSGKGETLQQLGASIHCTVSHGSSYVRVLVIEDEAKVANFIQKGLQQEQYAVDVARDGQEGAYQAENFDYDIVILDLMLPKVSGLSYVLRNLRAKKPSVPVLILTAKGSVGDRVKGLDSGADDYLAKPFAFAELLARIRALCAVASRKIPSSGVADLEMDIGHAPNSAGRTAHRPETQGIRPARIPHAQRSSAGDPHHDHRARLGYTLRRHQQCGGCTYQLASE